MLRGKIGNSIRGEEAIISYDEARIPILVVPTNEELAIARETVKLITQG